MLSRCSFIEPPSVACFLDAGLAAGVLDTQAAVGEFLAPGQRMKTKPTGFHLRLPLATILLAATIGLEAQIISSCHPVADTPQPEFAVSSAFDGTNFLIGIRGDANSPDTVGAQLLSPEGSRVGAFISTGRLMDGFADAPRVAFGGSNYLMAWTDAASHHPASDNDVYAQFISPAGDLAGSAFPVAQPTGNQAARGVASDGTDFLVIWSAADGLRGRRLSSTGQLLGGEVGFTAEDVQEAASVAYGGGQYLVTWVEGTDGAHAAKGRLLSASGQLSDVLPLSQNNSYYYNPISVAYGEGLFMVVWHRNADANADWNLRGRMVFPDGTLAGGELVLAGEPVNDFAWANNVAFDGQYFLLVWMRAEDPSVTTGVVLGQYWSRSGTAESSPFTIDDTARSKFGLGLSGADGRVLAVIDTALLTSEADVCARIISRSASNFSPPLFWERFTDYTFLQGPYRSTVDGRGGVFVVGSGGADVVNGQWYREPIRLLETNAAVDTAFQSEVSGGFATAIQADGKMVISSQSDGAGVVFRLIASGALDPSFTPVGFTQSIRHMAVLPDGKILVVISGNYFDNPNPLAIPVPKPTVFRLDANGQVDQSFQRPEFSESDFLHSPPVADSAGRILLGGRFATVNGISRSSLVRLLADGRVDESFAGSGSVPGGLGGIVRQIGIQSDGRVIVVGDLRVPAMAASSNRIAAIRFDANGQFDSTFMTNMVRQLGLRDYPRAMVLRPDDKFVTVSSGLRQFNADGSVAPFFYAVDFFPGAYWISCLSDGRLMVPGRNPAEGLDVFMPDGTPDVTLKTGGFGCAIPPTSYAFLDDGRIAVCGQFNRVGAQPQLGLAILNPETGQALPPQPDLASLVPEGVMRGSSGAAKVVPGPTNSLVFLAGVMDTNYNNQVLLGSVSGDGTLSAKHLRDLGMNDGDDIFALPNGWVFLTDNSFQGAVYDCSPLRRVLPNEDADPKFGGLDTGLRGELAQVDWNPDSSIWLIDIGRLHIMASLGPTNLLASVNTIHGEARLVRIHANGQVDADFSSPAVAGLGPSQRFSLVDNPRTGSSEMPGELAWCQEVFTDAAELPNDQILVCGRFTELSSVPVPYLARLNANGSLDTNFPGLRLEYTRSPFWEPRLTSIKTDTRGRIYVAGLFDRINTVPAPGLARLLPDGTVDATFQSPITVSPDPYLAVDLKVVGTWLYVFGNCQEGPTRRMGWRLQVGEALTLAWQLTTVGGRLELIVPASSASPTMVQASDDLAMWVDVFTNAPGTGATTFIDPEAGMKSQRFYRLRQ